MFSGKNVESREAGQKRGRSQTRVQASVRSYGEFWSTNCTSSLSCLQEARLSCSHQSITGSWLLPEGRCWQHETSGNFWFSVPAGKAAAVAQGWSSKDRCRWKLLEGKHAEAGVWISDVSEELQTNSPPWDSFISEEPTKEQGRSSQYEYLHKGACESISQLVWVLRHSSVYNTPRVRECEVMHPSIQV